MADNPLQPSPTVLAKLGSIIVHADEMLSDDGHHFDRFAVIQLIQDQDVQDWLQGMSKMAMIPVKRK